MSIEAVSLVTSKQIDFFQEIEGERVVCWFSCGATSAVACKLAIAENAGEREIEVVYNHVGWATPENGWRGEHYDSKRFMDECSDWFGVEVKLLSHPRFKDVDDVIESERYLNGVEGAKCTQQLKIAQRLRFQRQETDIQVYGFDSGEVDRAWDFREAWPRVRLYTPLIKRGLTKPDCLALLREVGIQEPEMYRLGYRNNNCIGCVKGAKGYWNKIRVDFPEVFARRSEQEKMLGRSCISGAPLNQLHPNAGQYKTEPDISCAGVCVDAVKEVENCVA